MQWLRKLLSDSGQAPKAFRPKLETLDQREMPSVSSVLTASGLTQFIVDNTNSLIVKSDAFGTVTIITGTSTSGVRTAQGFRTAGGGLGYDAVMMDGTLQHFEQDGGLLPNGTYTAADFGLPSDAKILDVGTAYDAMGLLRFDILITDTTAATTTPSSPAPDPTALDVTGRLFEYNQAAGGTLKELDFLPGVRWLSTYLDTAGGTGIAIGQTIRSGTTAPDELLVRKGDNVTGVTVLYDGADNSPAAITEYTQTVSPTLSAGAFPSIPPTVFGISPAVSRSVVIDVTFNSAPLQTTPGTYALEYALSLRGSAITAANVTGVGTDNSIKPGG